MAKKMVEIGAVELRKLQAKIKAQERAKEKRAARKIDGLSPHLKQKFRNACREVWMRSSAARKICLDRAELPNGFFNCEGAKHKGGRKVPKVYVDHVIPIGEVDSIGFFQRLGVDSKGLMNLCHECHKIKTAADKAAAKNERSFL